MSSKSELNKNPTSSKNKTTALATRPLKTSVVNNKKNLKEEKSIHNPIKTTLIDKSPAVITAKDLGNHDKTTTKPSSKIVDQVQPSVTKSQAKSLVIKKTSDKPSVIKNQVDKPLGTQYQDELLVKSTQESKAKKSTTTKPSKKIAEPAQPSVIKNQVDKPLGTQYQDEPLVKSTKEFSDKKPTTKPSSKKTVGPAKPSSKIPSQGQPSATKIHGDKPSIKKDKTSLLEHTIIPPQRAPVNLPWFDPIAHQITISNQETNTSNDNNGLQNGQKISILNEKIQKLSKKFIENKNKKTDISQEKPENPDLNKTLKSHHNPQESNGNNHNTPNKNHYKKKNITGTEHLYSHNNKNIATISSVEERNLKPNKLLIDTSIEGSTRIAKIHQENGKYKLITIIEEMENEENIQSNIYLASVSKIDKTNNSLFLQYDHNKTCFLNIKELIKQNLSEKEVENIQLGQKFIIQMVRERKNHKYPKVTTNIMMYGLYCNIILDVEPDLFYQNQNINHLPIYNSLQQQKFLKNIKIYLKQPPETINQKLLMDDIKYMIRTWKHIKSVTAQKKDIGLLHFEPHIQRMIRSVLDNNTEEIILDNWDCMERIKTMPFLFNKQQSKNIQFKEGNIFQIYNVAEEVHRVEKLSIIKEGLRLTFQKTEALVTVDVDYSSKTSQKYIKNLWDINREAAHLIIEEIIKKNIGGSVIIDFINMYMANEQHNIFVQLIKNQFANFGINCAVYNVKQLGFILLCLPYNKYDIFNRIYEKCHECHGGLVIKKNYQLQSILEAINDFIQNKKPFNQEEIYSDGHQLFIKAAIYNQLVQYKNFIIYRMMEKAIIPMIF